MTKIGKSDWSKRLKYTLLLVWGGQQGNWRVQSISIISYSSYKVHNWIHKNWQLVQTAYTPTVFFYLQGSPKLLGRSSKLWQRRGKKRAKVTGELLSRYYHVLSSMYVDESMVSAALGSSFWYLCYMLCHVEVCLSSQDVFVGYPCRGRLTPVCFGRNDFGRSDL